MELGLNLVIRDEADIAEDFLQYHYSKGVDIVFATDNGSRDGTLDILKKYEAQGRLVLRHEPPSDFSMHRWLTRQAEAAADRGVTWLLCCDTDEFIVPAAGGTIKDALRQFPLSCNCIAIQRLNFINTDRDYKDSPIVEMIYRPKQWPNHLDYPILPKVTFRPAAGTVLVQGAHRLLNGRDAEPQELLRIFHYPVRSYEQFVRKVHNAGSQYMQNKELPQYVGKEKKLWFDMLQKGNLEEEYRRRFHYSPQQLDAAIASGDLIETRELSDHIAALQRSGGDSGGADLKEQH